MVLDDHQVTLLELRVQPSRGIGDDQQPAAQLLHHADRESHLRGRVALVEVEPAFHRDHGVPRQRAADELALVALDRGPREVGDFRIGNGCCRVDFLGQGPQPGAQDDADCGDSRPA